VKINISKSFLIDVILFNQLIYFVAFVFDNVNYLWFALNVIIASSLLVFRPRIKLKFLPLFFVAFFLSLNYFIYLNSKLSSVIFSVSIILTSIVQLGFINDNFQEYNFQKFIKKTINFFLVFYIIQVILFNIGGIELNIFGLSTENTTIFRFNSLMSEPSYSSTVMVTLLFINQKLKTENSLFTEIIGFIFILLCQSLFGILLYLIYISIYHRKNFKKLFFIEFFSLLIIFLFFLTSEYFYRIKNIFDFFSQSQLDFFEIVKVEPSGAFRILPFILYIENFEFSMILNYLFGYGAGSSENYLSYELFKIGYGDNQYEGSFQGGFFPGFLIDYGIVAVILIIYSLKKIFLIKNNLFQYIILLTIMINVNINTQLFWFPLFLLFITKLYEENFS